MRTLQAPELSPEPSSRAPRGPALLAHQSRCWCSQAPGCGAPKPDWSPGVSEGVRPWLPAALSLSLATSWWETGSIFRNRLPSHSLRTPPAGTGAQGGQCRLLAGLCAWSWASPHPYPTPSRNGVRITHTENRGTGAEEKGGTPAVAEVASGKAGSLVPGRQTGPGCALYPAPGEGAPEFLFAWPSKP